MGAGMWLGMGLFWIALIALIVWLVVRLLPSRGDAGTTTAAPSPPMQESPMDILDHRLAAGDIDLDTYQAHRAALIAARGGQR